jgi:hypothetical protein
VVLQEAQQLLSLPSLDTAVGSLRKSTERTPRRAPALNARNVLAVLEFVEVAGVFGGVDDALEAGAAELTALAATLAVDAGGRGVGAEGEDRAEDGNGELHDGWWVASGGVEVLGLKRVWKSFNWEVRSAVSWWS